MALTKIINDKRSTLQVTNQIVIRAGQLMWSGEHLTAEQEDDNLTAEMLVEYANEMRAKHGAYPLTAVPQRSADQAENGWV